jgi:hypothetical protein
VLGGVGRRGRFGDVGVDGDVMMRLREVQGADRAVLESWWAASSALAAETVRRDSARRRDQLELRRMLGGMTDRERTWAERALVKGAALRVTPSARAHLRRMVWARSRRAAAAAPRRERQRLRDRLR